MTVAQLEQTLVAENAALKPDVEVARRIGGIERSERLTDAALGRLNRLLVSG
jgi:hypothetical protein